MYSGQAMVHTSGALGAEVLEPAQAAGHTDRRAFPPSSPSPTRNGRSPRSTARPWPSKVTTSWRCSCPRWRTGSVPRPSVSLPGPRFAYHAAAVLAAGGFVALLDAIAELGAVAGLDERGSPGDLRPAHRGHTGQRPGTRDRRGPDRTDHPRRRRDAGRISRRWRRTPRGPRSCVAAARREIELGTASWRARTGDRVGDDCDARTALCKGGL